MGILEDPERPQQMTTMVIRWLQENQDWLLILDNVQDIQLAVLAQLKPNFRKNIVVTTQNVHLHPQIAPMRLMHLDGERARLLLTRKSQLAYTKSEDQEFAVAELVDELQYLPLSIHLSNVFMQTKSASIGEYLKLYRQTAVDWADKLPEVPSSVKTAFTLTVLQIKDPECIRLLSFLSYVNCHEIIETVWMRFARKASFQRPHSKSSAMSVLTPLLDFGLVRYCDQRNLISIELVVQSVMRALLESGPLFDILTENERRPGYWIEVAVEIVCSSYPSQLLENLLVSDTLYPIAHSCLRIAEKYCIMVPSAATLQRRLADYLSMRGSYEEACHAYRLALHIKEHLYGVDDLHTISTLTNLGNTYAKARRYEDALSTFERARQVVHINTSLAHDMVGDICLSLGSVYSEMGRYKDAISQHEEAINIRATNLTIDFARLAEAHAGLADAHLKVGRFERASKSYQLALEAYESAPSQSDTSVWRVRERLGQTYSGLGMHTAAMEIYDSVIAIKRRIFGEDHAKVADTIHNMGVVLKDLGHFDRAIEYFQKAQEMYERACLYPDTVRVANTIKNLGVVYSQKGHHPKAIEYFQCAMQLEKQYGSNELGIASSLNNIGVAHARLGLYPEALMLYQEALGLLTRIRGPNHVETGDMIYNLGVTQISLDHAHLAKAHLEQSRRIFISALGKEHPKCIKVNKLLKRLAKQRHIGKTPSKREDGAAVELPTRGVRQELLPRRQRTRHRS